MLLAEPGMSNITKEQILVTQALPQLLADALHFNMVEQHRGASTKNAV
jgi:hypothetical protein